MNEDPRGPAVPQRRGGAPVPDGGSPPPPGGDGESLAASVRALVGAVLGTMTRLGKLSLDGAGDALEAPSRALARRSTAAAAAQPRPVPDRASLARALAEKPVAPMLGGATATALAARVARRIGPLRFVARRTPLWLVAALLPALHASVVRGAEELTLVASHLYRRARDAGVTPDRERVCRTAVQVVSGQNVDADDEPRHARLVTAWLQRALRATLPFAEGVSTRDPDGMAAAAADVDVRTLGT